MYCDSSFSKHEVADSYYSCRYCDTYDEHLACLGLWVEDRFLTIHAFINLTFICGSSGPTGLYLLDLFLLLILIGFA